MSDKTNKIFNTILLMIFFLFNIFGNNSNMLIVNAKSVSNDDLLGILVNSSQGGASRGNGEEIRRLGNHMLGGQKNTNHRIGKVFKRGGNKVAFNPSLIDIDILHNDYGTYYQNISVGNDNLIIPINKT